MNKMKYKLIIAVLYMIMSACNNTDSNEFAFSNYSWECPKEGGRKIFTSNKDVQSPNQKIPDRKTKCVIKTHINIKQNVIFGAK